jgi:D-alanyl-D-alanine carboxypeptidase
MRHALVAVLGITAALSVPVVVIAQPLLVEGVELVPYEAVGYRKGRPFKLRVVQLGWAEVEVKTAAAFLAMREAAAADGIELAIRNGFRPPEFQEWLYQAYKEGWGNKAARPGHSNHQSGRALDLYIDTPETYAWLDANARRYGFRRTVRSEPWHWEHNGRRLRHPRKRASPRGR